MNVFSLLVARSISNGIEIAFQTSKAQAAPELLLEGRPRIVQFPSDYMMVTCFYKPLATLSHRAMLR
jgi:hypothetical protein